MCNRHELPPLIEPDVPGIVSQRIKRKEPTLDPADPLNLQTETEAIFKGLRNALLIILIALLLGWSLSGAFQFFSQSISILPVGDWSKP
jgi:hypothetical protein